MITNCYYADGVDEKGIPVYVRNPTTREDNNLASAVAGKRMSTGLYDWGFVPALNQSYTPEAVQCMMAWDHYQNYGYIHNIGIKHRSKVWTVGGQITPGA